jgi:hypothetical protein
MEGGFVLRVVVGAVLGMIAGTEALAGVVLMSAVVDIVVLMGGLGWMVWWEEVGVGVRCCMLASLVSLGDFGGVGMTWQLGW